MDRVGLDWSIFHWIILERIGADRIEADCIALEWIAWDCSGLDWVAQLRTVHCAVLTHRTTCSVAGVYMQMPNSISLRIKVYLFAFLCM